MNRSICRYFLLQNYFVTLIYPQECYISVETSRLVSTFF